MSFSTGARVALKAFNIGLVLLVIAGVVVLGSMVMKLRKQQESPAAPLIGNVQSTEPPTVQELLLRNIPVNASPSAEAAYFAKVDQYAYETDHFEINNCKPEFEIMRVDKKAPLYIQNNDDVERTIWFGTEMQYKIPAKRAIEIEPEYSTASKGYAILCDGGPIVALLRFKP